MGQFTAGRQDHHVKMAYKWRIARLSASIALTALAIAPDGLCAGKRQLFYSCRLA